MSTQHHINHSLHVFIMANTIRPEIAVGAMLEKQSYLYNVFRKQQLRLVSV